MNGTLTMAQLAPIIKRLREQGERLVNIVCAECGVKHCVWKPNKWGDVWAYHCGCTGQEPVIIVDDAPSVSMQG